MTRTDTESFQSGLLCCLNRLERTAVARGAFLSDDGNGVAPTTPTVEYGQSASGNNHSRVPGVRRGPFRYRFRLGHAVTHHRLGLTVEGSGATQGVVRLKWRVMFTARGAGCSARQFQRASVWCAMR